MKLRNLSRCIAIAAAPLFAAIAPASAADAEAGMEIYDRVGCWSCHNYEGTGGRHGPTIARTQHSYEAFSAFVRTTAGEMPPHTERMVPEDDLRAIYAYLQSVPEPPSAASIPLLQDVFPD